MVDQLVIEINRQFHSLISRIHPLTHNPASHCLIQRSAADAEGNRLGSLVRLEHFSIRPANSLIEQSWLGRTAH